MRYHDQRGYSLLIVLIFLQVLSLLGWYSLSASKLMMTLNRDTEAYHHQRYLKQKAISQIENKIQGNESCVIVTLPISKLSTQQTRWWKLHGCETTDHLYDYVIESLGVHPCAKIKSNNHNSSNAKFYRITLRSKSDTIHADSYLLQSIIALKINEATNCPFQTNWIRAGVQMRREI